jgi:hypothetical protein
MGEISLRDARLKPLVAPLALATLFAVPYVLLTTFTDLPWFDDEGTLLVGFRAMLTGQRMYDDIYSLYGPLYNEVYGLIYVVLGVPLSHTSGRVISAMLWLAYSGGFAAFSYYLTRSRMSMLWSYVIVLYWLANLAASPGHPQEISLFLLAILLLQACAVDRGNSISALSAIGVTVAALGLIKVNLGAYAGGVVGLALLRITRPSVWTRLATPIAIAALLLLPVLLESLLFNFLWVKLYIVFSTLVIGGSLLIFQMLPRQEILWPRHWVLVVGGACATCLIIIGGSILAGSSLPAILNAVIFQNVNFVRHWYVPMNLGVNGLFVACGSLMIAVSYYVTASWPEMRLTRDLGLIALRFVYVSLGLALMFSLARPLKILTPLCWLIMLPPATSPGQYIFGRSVLGLLGAVFSLYAFPVAGDQVTIAALPAMLAVPIVAHDLVTEVRRLGLIVPLISSRPLGAFASVALVLFGVLATLRSAGVYLRDVPLGLPGTSAIRVDKERAEELRWVNEHLAACENSYSIPGMWSFAFWTGHPLVTGQNINDVLAFISPAQQEAIVRELSRKPDLCVVYNPVRLRWFDRGQIETNPPLLRYLKEDLSPVAQHGAFVILKQRPSAS